MEPSFRVESALFSPSSDDSPRALFAPLHYEPNYAYPLIVWLHGPDDDERQLVRIMPSVSLRNYVAVAPRGFRGPACQGGEGPVGGGYGWRQTADEIQRTEQRVFDSMEAARAKMHVAQDRVFLAGYDAGGTMALRVAMNQPHAFAGVLSLGGPLPTGQSPFGRLAELRRIPVFLAVGRDSLEYPASLVCDNLRLLHSAGMSVTLRQYPCGHQLSPSMFRDMDRWLIDQVTQRSQAPREAGNVH